MSIHSSHANSYICPDVAIGETQEDCPWSAVARDLISESEAGKPVLARLKSLLPELHRSIESDSALKHLKDLWGQSLNYDEGAKAITVHPAIIGALSSFFSVQSPSSNNVVHAGLEHTYGYLFSILKTPFGYKRDRWVSGKIEQGFGLNKGTFGPAPDEGTLFSNITYFIARIAFREEPTLLSAFEKTDGVATAVKRFRFADLRPIRLKELVKVPGERSREVTLITDLVPYFKASEKNAYLLVYSVADSANHGGQPKLVTAFPVEASFAGNVTHPRNLGTGKPVITRYNAYVPGLTGKSATGTREIVNKDTPSGN